MQIIPLNLDSFLLLLHNSKLAYYGYSISQQIVNLKLISGYKYALPTRSNTHFIFKIHFCLHCVVNFLHRKYWLLFTLNIRLKCLFSTNLLANYFRTGMISIYMFIIVISCVLVCYKSNYELFFSLFSQIFSPLFEKNNY